MIVHTSHRRLGDVTDKSATAVDPCKDLHWEEYCDCKFANDQAMRAKCKSKPWSCCPFGVCPPWADPNAPMGASCRGLPRQQDGGFWYDAAYSVQVGLSAVSLVDKVVVPMQTKSIIANEQTEAAQFAVDQQAEAAVVKAAAQRRNILNYAKWGGIAFGGVAVVMIAMEYFPKKGES